LDFVDGDVVGVVEGLGESFEGLVRGLVVGYRKRVSRFGGVGSAERDDR
jgi:hypothetical protein